MVEGPSLSKWKCARRKLSVSNSGVRFKYSSHISCLNIIFPHYPNFLVTIVLELLIWIRLTSLVPHLIFPLLDIMLLCNWTSFCLLLTPKFFWLKAILCIFSPPSGPFFTQILHGFFGPSYCEWQVQFTITCYSRFLCYCILMNPMGNRWRNNGNSVRLPKSLQMVIAAMKLKDAYSLEEKLWPT